MTADNRKPLDQMTLEELGKLFPIVLTEHDPKWQDHYNKEEENIRNAVGSDDIIRIQHIGSTAVKDLISKPSIDILVEIKEETDTKMVIEKIRNIGYHYTHQPENPPPHMMFVKGYTEQGFKGQAFHIHIRYPGDWDEIYFRDYLKDHPKVAGQYAELKLKLARKYRNDRDGYTKAKTEFIQKISKLARREANQRNS